MAYEPRKFKVKNIKSYSPEVKMFRVETDMNPLPGQFFQVSLLGKGESALASCSFSENYVDILVRRVGNVTGSLFKLKRGDNLFIRGPYGNGYDIEKLKGKNLVLVAGGTGMAPITSLIEYLEKNREKFGEVSIYFAFRDERHILLADRINRWKKIFRIELALDGENKKVGARKGPVANLIWSDIKSPGNTAAVLCGPEPMMEAVSRKLNEIGIDNSNIYWNMERRMECALGSCGRCLIEDVYVCHDGPVFRYDMIKEKIENEAEK